MDSIKKERIALFRYGIIFPLLDERLQWGEKSQIIDEICAAEHDIPYSRQVKISKPTVYSWLRAYGKKQRIEDLYPAERSDKGRYRTLSSELELALRRFRDEHPYDKLTTLIKKAYMQGIIMPDEVVKMSTVYRMFKGYDRQKRAKTAKDMRRFTMEHCNDCWMLDAMTGPRISIDQSGRRRVVRSKLWAVIDDKSRLIPYAQFYRDETAESLIDCLIKAFSSRGLPRKIFTDNGSAMRDHRLKLGCASLQVQLSYSRAYSPASKAKIERLFATVRMQFLPTLGPEPLDLYDLNRAWQGYLQQYNTRFHRGINMTPLECYLKEVEAVRPAPQHLAPYFRAREERKVSLARTVSLQNRLYEVPLGYTGLTLELRFFDLDQVEAFYEGKSIGMLRYCDQIANARAHRGNSV